MIKELITPCLWCDGTAKQTAAFYCSIFKDAKIVSDTPMVVEFTASGHKFTCLNGGSKYAPNPSISFFYICETEDELDEIWKAMEQEGKVLMPLDKYPWAEKYGWIQDQYSVSWQLSLSKLEDVGQKITPCLLFVGGQCGNAEEALNHYTSIFQDSSVDGIMHYENDKSMVQHAQFALNGQKFMVMDSNEEHQFSFSEGISLMIGCDTQEEIDYYWDKFTAEGEESMCGWLKDKFGVSWQVYPNILGELMSDSDRAQRILQVFGQIRKFNIEELKNA